MRLYFVNDTSDAINWGCRGTTRALARMISAVGADICRIVPLADMERSQWHVCADTGQKIDLCPERWEQFEPLAARVAAGEVLRDVRDGIESAHHVFINGEGSIYDLQRKGRFMLFMAYLAKRLGKPCSLVNATCDLHDELMHEMASQVLPLLDYVALREPRSVEACRPFLGERALLVPDATFIYQPASREQLARLACREDYYSVWPGRARGFRPEEPYICVAGSSIYFRPDRPACDPRPAYAALCRELAKLAQVVLVCTDKPDEQLLLPVARELDLPVVGTAIPTQQAVDLLGNAALLVGGRWHPSIYALTGGTPVLTLTANTYKTQALQELMASGLPTFDALRLDEHVGELAGLARQLLGAGDSARAGIVERVRELRLQSWENVASIRDRRSLQPLQSSEPVQAPAVEPLKVTVMFVSMIPEAKRQEFLEVIRGSIRAARDQQPVAGVEVKIVLGDDGSDYLAPLAGSDVAKLSEEATASVRREFDLDVDEIHLVGASIYYHKSALINHYIMSDPSFDYLIVMDDDEKLLDDRCIARFVRHFRNGYDFVVGRRVEPDGALRCFFDPKVLGSTVGLSRSLLQGIGGFCELARTWGCGEDSALFWQVRQVVLDGRFSAIYDGSIMSHDRLSGRWLYCQHKAGGLKFFRESFRARFGVDPHHNASRDKPSWLEMAPPERPHVPEVVTAGMTLRDFRRCASESQVAATLNQHLRRSIKAAALTAELEKLYNTFPLLRKMRIAAVIRALFNGARKVRNGLRRVSAALPRRTARGSRVPRTQRELLTVAPSDNRAYPLVAMCSGLWQLAVLCAALKASGRREQDCLLVLYGENIPADEAALLKDWAEKIGSFADVRLLPRELSRQALARYGTGEQFARTVRAALGVPEGGAGELWLPKLFHAPEKAAAEALPDAPIQLFEEGLAVYVDWNLLPDDIGAESSPTQRIVMTNGLCGGHLDRVRNAWMCLAEGISMPRYLRDRAAHIPAADLRQVLARLNAPAPETFGMNGRPVVLFLAQNLSMYRVLSREEEVQTYIQAMEGILAQGYAVCWKEHPRTREPFWPEVSSTMRVRYGPDVPLTRLELPPALPVETLFEAAPGRIAAVVSMFSSSLFYLDKIWSVPTYTYLPDEVSVNHPLYQALFDIARRFAKPVFQMPPAPGYEAPAVELQGPARAVPARPFKRPPRWTSGLCDPAAARLDMASWRDAQLLELDFHKRNTWRPSPDFMHATARLFEHFGFSPDSHAGKTIIDLGCGSRLRTKYFRDATLIAIDPLADAFRSEIDWCDLDDAAEVYSRAAEERITQCQGRADLVVSINVLDGCYDFERAIRNVRAYLKRGGLAFLSFDKHDLNGKAYPLSLDETLCEAVFLRAGLRIEKHSTGMDPRSSTSKYGRGVYCLNYWCRAARD